MEQIPTLSDDLTCIATVRDLTQVLHPPTANQSNIPVCAGQHGTLYSRENVTLIILSFYTWKYLSFK